MEDNMILDLYWSRSESAISETAMKYGRYCAKIAMNILQNREDTDECVNDTYLKAWNSIPTLRPTIFSSFLGKITRNLSLNKYKALRTKKRGGYEVALLLDELDDCISPGDGLDFECETSVLAKAIDDFLSSIDDENLIVFTRRYWYVDSIASIAKRFQMSESKVKSMLYRTRNKLRVYLEKEGIEI